MPSPSRLYFHQHQKGKLLAPGEFPALALARSHKYGDGIFESILCLSSRPYQLKLHLNRLFSGMKVLGLQAPETGFRQQLQTAIQQACADLHTPFSRIRLQVWRAGQGTYLPENDHADWMIETYPLPEHPWGKTPSGGLRLSLFDQVPLVFSPLSSVKSCSALPYVLAARHARSKGCDDALLFSVDGVLAEASSSNLFLRRHNVLLTPDLSSGCLPGTLRHRILANAHKAGLEIVQQPLTLHDLHEADEAFLSNAIRGIQPISKVVGSAFKPKGHDAALSLGRILRP